MANTYENKYLDGVGLTHLWTKIKDYVSANSNKYTLPTATTSTLGGVKLGSDTVQTVTATTVSSIANRTYAIQKNNNGQLVVNVPWENTHPDLTPYAWIHAPANLISALTEDLLTLFQTNGERRISRTAESSERIFFDNTYKQIKNGGRVAGLIVANSSMCAYLQFTLLNEPYLTFTVMNVELGAASYGYIVEYNFNTKVLLSEKTRLTTQYDLDNSVQEVKNAVDKIKDRITYITYADLKALRDNGNLIPGQQYQITDYITTVNPNDSDIQSAGHQFDIIVVADTPYSLNENARATYHGSSKKITSWPDNITLEDVQPLYEFTPFDDYKEEPDAGDLHIIQLFDIKNGIPVLINCDTEGESRYVNHVADIKFVITDEEENYSDWISSHQDVIVELDYNEDGIPILYKNNPMNSDVTSLWETDYGDWLEYYDDYEFEGNVYNRWKKWDDDQEDYYPIYILTNIIVENNRFTITQEELISDIEFEYIPSEFDAFYEYSGLYEFDGEVYNLWLDKHSGHTYYGILTKKIFDVEIDYFSNSNIEAWQLKYTLFNNKYNWTSLDSTGTIYWMKDEFNNECPYDFKNIMFYDPTNTYEYVYTFSNGDNDASLTGMAWNNTIKPANEMNWIILQGTSYNNIFETGCYNITITDGSIDSYFGSNCYNITLKKLENCIFQNGCHDLYCDISMYNIKAENGVYNLTIEAVSGVSNIYNIILTTGIHGSPSNDYTIRISESDASRNTQAIYRPYSVNEILLDD